MSQTNKPTVNSFFCGAGGLDLGLIEAGFQVVSAWDFDKFAVQSYQANIGDHVRQADIRQMLAGDLPKADLWAFGFPCQDLSVAGKQAGLFEGKRSGLFFEVMRLLDETELGKKPRILLAENVKGLKPYLPVLQSEYAKRGYVMHLALYNSKYFGVPQSRERYFVVGVREDTPFQFPEQQTDFIPKLSSILEEKVDEKYYLSDEKSIAIMEKFSLTEPGEAHGCPLKFLNRNQNVLPTYAMCCDVSGTNGVLEPQVDVIGRLEMKGKDQWKRVYDTEGLSPTLTAICGGMQEPKILVPGKYGQKGGFVPLDVAPTLDASAFKGLGCNQARPAVAEIYPRYRVRKLTPTEFGRLQGFPMDRWKQVVSDSQAYKQFGNAVTVPVAKVIGQAILEQLF